MRGAFLILIFSVFAGALQPKQESMEKLVRDYQSTKEALVRDEVHQRRVMSSLFEINKKMKKIVTERSDLVQERMVTESITRELAEKILMLEQKLKDQKALMRERLMAIYKFGGQGLARLLFSSSSSAQLERNLKVLGIIAKRDLDLIKDYSKNMKDLESKRSKFTIRLATLKKIEKKIQTQEVRLTEENTHKTQLLGDIRKSKAFRLTKLNGLRAKTDLLIANDETGALDLLFRPSIFEQKGKLPPPLDGPITQGFGIIRDSEYNVSWAHKGVFISAPVGSKIRSVFDGKVSYVGEVPGFGRTIIIDHGDHYYSVYGYSKLPLVSEGMEVKQNHVIAESGIKVDESESGLYFEIRHFSEPYDPKHWLKGKQL